MYHAYIHTCIHEHSCTYAFYRFLELKPVFSALWLRWQVFYEVYKQCYHWLNERLTRAEQFSPLAKSNMKSVKIEMEQLKVTSLYASILYARVLILVHARI